MYFSLCSVHSFVFWPACCDVVLAASHELLRKRFQAVGCSSVLNSSGHDTGQGLTYWLRKPRAATTAGGAYIPDPGSDEDSDDGNSQGLRNIYRRGDSVSSFRRSEDAEALVLPSDRPLFFIHGVGFGLVGHPCLLEGCPT